LGRAEGPAFVGHFPLVLSTSDIAAFDFGALRLTRDIVTRWLSTARPRTAATTLPATGKLRKGLLAICALRETQDDGAMHPRRWLTNLYGLRQMKWCRHLPRD
jgi:hypothetical protein